MRLVGTKDEPKMIAERSGKDWTAAMNSYADKRVKSLKALNLRVTSSRRTHPVAVWKGCVSITLRAFPAETDGVYLPAQS